MTPEHIVNCLLEDEDLGIDIGQIVRASLGFGAILDQHVLRSGVAATQVYDETYNIKGSGGLCLTVVVFDYLNGHPRRPNSATVSLSFGTDRISGDVLFNANVYGFDRRYDLKLRVVETLRNTIEEIKATCEAWTANKAHFIDSDGRRSYYDLQILRKQVEGIMINFGDSIEILQKQ